MRMASIIRNIDGIDYDFPLTVKEKIDAYQDLFYMDHPLNIYVVVEINEESGEVRTSPFLHEESAFDYYLCVRNAIIGGNKSDASAEDDFDISKDFNETEHFFYVPNRYVCYISPEILSLN